MRVLLQRVSQASVRVDGQIVGEIGWGLLAFLGVAPEDTETDVKTLVEKMVNLRIFADQAGKMNLSLLDSGGEVLAVSQFTLYADVRRGRRPGFSNAASPEIANRLFEQFKATLSAYGLSVASGIFGASMQIELKNEGPVTIWLDTKEL